MTVPTHKPQKIPRKRKTKPKDNPPVLYEQNKHAYFKNGGMYG